MGSDSYGYVNPEEQNRRRAWTKHYEDLGCSWNKTFTAVARKMNKGWAWPKKK